MISKQKVEHVARLARLGVDKKELEEMEKDLSSILDYIEKLKEVDISDVDVYSSSRSIKKAAREDKAERTLSQQSEKLRELMPRQSNKFLKVKQVF